VAWRFGIVVAAAVLGVGLFLAPAVGWTKAGGESDASAEQAAFSEEAFQSWLDELRAEAREAGISEKTLDMALQDVKPIRRVIRYDRRQPEFTQTFRQYIDHRITQNRVKRGRALLKKHHGLLEDIYAQYRVPPRYIIAFWGLETSFGTYQGGFRVIDALVTLAYDQRRPEFFRKQLLAALKIIEKGHIVADQMKGSWAGAMGQMQFMPTTFAAYAVDYTGDGRKDIWNSVPDAFASAANFLASLGWRPGQRWGRRVSLPDDFDPALATLAQKKPLTAWARMGVRRADGTALPKADMKGSVILPEGRKGPAFVVYPNFRVIMGWNRSVNYALSVGLLADRLTGAGSRKP